MKASDLFVKCLEEEGIEYIFGMPQGLSEESAASLAGLVSIARPLI
jgi:thiamine pyrophosphate-dependent acetolactate synthase large subunit-like protein